MPPSKKLKTSETINGKERKPHSTTEAVADSPRDCGPDWREICMNVYEVNRYALDKNILTDVTFNVGEELVPFHAHRLMLALRSPVFEAMFYGPLAEKGDTITIPDVDPEGFRHLLSFIYWDAFTFKNDVTAFKTYFVADKYCVSNLKYICERYLYKCELSPSNIWIYLEGSQFLNSQSIINRCFSFLQRNTEEALHHNSFLDVSTKTIELVLGMDSLNITEMDLLLNVVRWAESKSNEDEEHSLQSILTPLLKFIHFGDLRATQFISFLETQNLKDLIQVQDALDILKHINKPSTCPLPDWCCTKTGRYSEKKTEKHCFEFGKKRTSKDSSPALSKSDKDVLTSEDSMSSIDYHTSSSSSSSSCSTDCECDSCIEY